MITDLGFELLYYKLDFTHDTKIHSEMVLYNTFIEIWYCIYIENYEFVVGKSVNMYASSSFILCILCFYEE